MFISRLTNSDKVQNEWIKKISSQFDFIDHNKRRTCDNSEVPLEEWTEF